MTVKQKTRDGIPEKYKWHLYDIFANDDLWKEEYEYILTHLAELEAFQGKLTSGATISECFSLYNSLAQRMSLVIAYAHLKHHEDMSLPRYQSMKDQSVGCAVKLSGASAFIEPEIISADESVINAFVDAQPIYAHYIQNLLRSKAHVRSSEVEELLAHAGEIADASYNIFSMLESADMKFGTVTDEEGREVELTHGRFISFMESKDRTVRENVFKTFYRAFIAHKNTLASAYYGSVKSDIFFSRAWNYPSALEASLFDNNIPRSVCDSLIQEVNNHLPHLHKYMALRKKRLNVDELHMYDIYAPIVKDADTKIEYEEAKDTVLKALAPLGEEYCSVVKRGFDSGWIDVYESANKHTGAYSWDITFGVHPYVLLNFDNRIDDMFTLAHEMGHALHNYYTETTQPFIYAGYSIFAAEVASTVNETLLTNYLLKTLTDPDQRAYVINHYLEQFRTTLFRQTMFAEFEMKAHEMAERDEPLTVENLCGIYRELNERYYGKDMIIDNEIDYEWARIPHFYNAFYVYQYATGISAAQALSHKILTEGRPAVDAYLEFLKCGASVYPIDALKKAGVDMTTSKPVKSAMEIFVELVDKMEGLA